MKIAALCPVRNEEWCLSLTLRAMMDWVDFVVILDHASTDHTPQIIRDVAAEFPGRVHAYRDDNPIWQEMAHRNFILDEARKLGATHAVCVDADECLSGNLLGSIRDMMPIGPVVLQLPWLCLARSVDRFYTAGSWFENDVSVGFEALPRFSWSSARRGGYDFHRRHPILDGDPNRAYSMYNPLDPKAAGLMHLQFVSERRLRAKQALYKLTEQVRWPGRTPIAKLNEMYGRAIYESDPATIATESCPESWWAPYAHLMKYLDVDAEPWQEATCRSMLAEHGRDKFTGLDLFGVDK